MSTNDYLAPIAAKLTINGAINLKSTVSDPDPVNPEAVHGKGRTFTGFGKYTSMAARGVENHLISLGLAERRGPYQHAYITPLGRELAAYVDTNWEALRFRQSKG